MPCPYKCSIDFVGAKKIAPARDRQVEARASMAHPRFEKADPLKQEAILQAAAKEFARVGYAGASLNRILLAAGVSKGSFYYYFDDKADLACTVLLWAYRDVIALFDRITLPERPEDFWDTIERFSNESLELAERAPDPRDLLSRLSHAVANDRELEARAVKVLVKAAETWEALLTRGQALGVVRVDLPVRTMIDMFTAIKESLLREFTANNHIVGPDEWKQMGELLLDLFRRVCSPTSEVSR
jgi:AcrR family transcriptional regulator